MISFVLPLRVKMSGFFRLTASPLFEYSKIVLIPLTCSFVGSIDDLSEAFPKSRCPILQAD
jgi:hypothetical protein